MVFRILCKRGVGMDSQEFEKTGGFGFESFLLERDTRSQKISETFVYTMFGTQSVDHT